LNQKELASGLNRDSNSKPADEVHETNQLGYDSDVVYIRDARILNRTSALIALLKQRSTASSNLGDGGGPE
jgi:hypothetical protein